MTRAVVITIPAQDGAELADLPEYADVLASFHDLISTIEATYPRRVPKTLIRALQRHREDVIALGGLRLGVAAVRVN